MTQRWCHQGLQARMAKRGSGLSSHLGCCSVKMFQIHGGKSRMRVSSSYSSEDSISQQQPCQGRLREQEPPSCRLAPPHPWHLSRHMGGSWAFCSTWGGKGGLGCDPLGSPGSHIQKRQKVQISMCLWSSTGHGALSGWLDRGQRAHPHSQKPLGGVAGCHSSWGQTHQRCSLFSLSETLEGIAWNNCNNAIQTNHWHLEKL